MAGIGAAASMAGAAGGIAKAVNDKNIMIKWNLKQNGIIKKWKICCKQAQERVPIYLKSLLRVFFTQEKLDQGLSNHDILSILQNEKAFKG